MSSLAPDAAGRIQPPDPPSGRPAQAVAVAQPPTAQPTTTQPTTTQPPTAQPTTAQPTTAQPTTAQPTTAQPTTTQPTTTQPTAAAQTHVARLIVLIRWIIAYGTDLAASLNQRATQPEFRWFAERYRQGDLATIAARIRRGLLLALGLEARFVALAAGGQDLAIAGWRAASPGARSSAGANPARTPCRVNIIDLPLDRLPTAEEIAEELHRRPVGAVLVDICRDLGLQQNDLPLPLASLLREAIILYGGNLVTLMFAETRPAMLAAFRARLDFYRHSSPGQPPPDEMYPDGMYPVPCTDTMSAAPPPAAVSPVPCTGPP